MKKVIVSACLLGECCRYDGATKKDNGVVESLKGWEIIPFCPEAPLFGTPRERINVVNIESKNRIITEVNSVDVTDNLKDEIYSFIKKHPKVDSIILKSKSPSCGFGTTPILDKNKNIISYGNGIAADIFTNTYTNINIKDENAFFK